MAHSMGYGEGNATITTVRRPSNLILEYGKHSVEYRRELAYVFKPMGQYQCLVMSGAYPTIELREFSKDGYETTVRARALVWSAE